MSRKIVAIGGGENGRLQEDGTHAPYETAAIDREVVRLTGKEHPNFLMLAHASPLEGRQRYFETMKNIYDAKLGCECKDLKSDKLTDKEYVQNLIDWADIIYEGGGNTLDMAAMWKDTGFDKILRSAWQAGKVLCGLSAGANCWFKECSTDSLQIKYGPDQPIIKMDCLGFLEGFFVPHCDEAGRRDTTRELLKSSRETGLLLSNCAALEVIDGEYRLIFGNSACPGFAPYGLKAYWKNGEYTEEKIDPSPKFKPFASLVKKGK